MITMKSLGVTSYELASIKNFMDSNKKVVLLIYKDESYTHLVCSQELSDKLRSCKNESEFKNLLEIITNLPIGNGLALEAYH